jgi:hypothetical protein
VVGSSLATFIQTHPQGYLADRGKSLRKTRRALTRTPVSSKTPLPAGPPIFRRARQSPAEPSIVCRLDPALRRAFEVRKMRVVKNPHLSLIAATTPKPRQFNFDPDFFDRSSAMPKPVRRSPRRALGGCSPPPERLTVQVCPNLVATGCTDSLTPAGTRAQFGLAVQRRPSSSRRSQVATEEPDRQSRGGLQPRYLALRR